MMRRTGMLIPNFEFETLSGTVWQSRSNHCSGFRLLVIYRGMWCPHCKAQLQALNAIHDSLVNAGVVPVVVSADTRERAATSKANYGLDQLDLGYQIPIDSARALGVFVSAGISSREMPLFCEPASFLIDAGNRVQAAWIASNAFARTRMSDIRAYIDFLKEHPDRAPRGSD